MREDTCTLLCPISSQLACKESAIPCVWQGTEAVCSVTGGSNSKPAEVVTHG